MGGAAGGRAPVARPGAAQARRLQTPSARTEGRGERCRACCIKMVHSLPKAHPHASLYTNVARHTRATTSAHVYITRPSPHDAFHALRHSKELGHMGMQRWETSSLW